MNRRQARKGASTAPHRPGRSTSSSKKGKGQPKDYSIEVNPLGKPDESSLYSQADEASEIKALPKAIATPFRPTLLRSDVKTLVTRLTGNGA